MSTEAALEAVRRDVLLTTFTCLLVVFTGLLPVAITRDLHVNPWMIVPHLASYAVLLAAYLRRERLSSRTVAAVIIVTLYVLGTVGLLSVGIVGLDFLAYGVIVIAATMAFGSRSGVLAAVICGATYAEAIVTGLRATEPQRQIRVDIEAGMIVAADPGLIHNVLQNLLANAWKFTSRTQDARIEFSAREADGGRIHCVRDNGAGFDPDRAERLFEPFVRRHDSREFAGNGVGLATTRRIIERHGGRIWAESRRGEGATLLFTLRP